MPRWSRASPPSCQIFPASARLAFLLFRIIDYRPDPFSLSQSLRLASANLAGVVLSVGLFQIGDGEVKTAEGTALAGGLRTAVRGEIKAAQCLNAVM